MDLEQKLLNSKKIEFCNILQQLMNFDKILEKENNIINEFILIFNNYSVYLNYRFYQFDIFVDNLIFNSIYNINLPYVYNINFLKNVYNNDFGNGCFFENNNDKIIKLDNLKYYANLSYNNNLFFYNNVYQLKETIYSLYIEKENNVIVTFEQAQNNEPIYPPYFWKNFNTVKNEYNSKSDNLITILTNLINIVNLYYQPTNEFLNAKNFLISKNCLSNEEINENLENDKNEIVIYFNNLITLFTNLKDLFNTYDDKTKKETIYNQIIIPINNVLNTINNIENFYVINKLKNYNCFLQSTEFYNSLKKYFKFFLNKIDGCFFTYNNIKIILDDFNYKRVSIFNDIKNLINNYNYLLSKNEFLDIILNYKIVKNNNQKLQIKLLINIIFKQISSATKYIINYTIKENNNDLFSKNIELEITNLNHLQQFKDEITEQIIYMPILINKISDEYLISDEYGLDEDIEQILLNKKYSLSVSLQAKHENYSLNNIINYINITNYNFNPNLNNTLGFDNNLPNIIQNETILKENISLEI